MRVRLAAMALMVAALGLGTVPAGADHHPACGTSPHPIASVALTLNAGAYDYSGNVVCQGATIEITSLAIQQVPLPAESGPTATGCTNTCAASGTATAAPMPGLWRVVMKFNVTGNGKTFTDLVRCRPYLTTDPGRTPRLIPFVDGGNCAIGS